MSITFAGNAIVADAAGVWYGESKFVAGDVEDEIYERTVPRASGVYEVRATVARRTHVVEVVYFTTNPQTVVNVLTALRLSGAYGVLADTVAGSFVSCRLVSVQYSPKIAGAGGVTVLPATLTFKQVVI